MGLQMKLWILKIDDSRENVQLWCFMINLSKASRLMPRTDRALYFQDC